MKNFKKLSREELKNTFGGRGCKLVVPNGNGGFTTFSGTCDRTYTSTYDPIGDRFVVSSRPYCNTGNGVAYTLTSNGGNSAC